MSYQLVKKIILNSRELTDGEFRVLVVIADHRNEKTGQCNPGMDLIAKEVGMKKRSIRRILRQLETGKRLVTQKGGRGPGNSHQYDFPETQKEDREVPLKKDNSVPLISKKRRTETSQKEDASVPRTEKEQRNNNYKQSIQVGRRKGTIQKIQNNGN